MSNAVKKPSLAATFPECSAFVAEIRRVFSVDGGETPADINLIYMEENGQSVGQPMDESRYKEMSFDYITMPRK